MRTPTSAQLRTGVVDGGWTLDWRTRIRPVGERRATIHEAVDAATVNC